MKENLLKSFINDTYKGNSIIPYIITLQVVLFVLLHIFDLLTFSQTTSIDLYQFFYRQTTLSSNINELISKPWSFIIHPFIYTDLFSIIFDCLWLYWLGNLFLTFLNQRQLNTLLFSSLYIGATLILVLSLLPWSSQNYAWNSINFALAALTCSIYMLTPELEVRLFLFGNVRFKIVAIVYLLINAVILFNAGILIGLVYVFSIIWGGLYIYALKQGNDLSRLFVYKKRRKLKVIRNTNYTTHHQEIEYPNQQQVDELLDKISLHGYKSLSTKEKEILFKASKKQD